MKFRSRAIVRWLATATVVAATASTAGAAEKFPYIAKVARERVTVRAQASGAQQRIGVLKRGDEVEVRRILRDWAQIQVPRHFPIWISARYVRRDGDVGTVTGNRVNLRPSPDTSGSVLGQSLRGDQLRIVGHESGWYQILPPKAARAWMLKSVLTYVRPGRGAKAKTGTGRLPAPPTGGRTGSKPKSPAGPNFLALARAAFRKSVQGAPIGARVFARSKDLLAKARTAGERGHAISRLEREIAKAESDNGQFKKEMADLKARWAVERRVFKKTMDDIRRRLENAFKKRRVQAWTVTGTFDAMGWQWDRPGSHTLMNDKGVRYILKSSSLNLDKALWYGKTIGVRGQVVDIPGWGHVIEVHEIKLLEPLRKKKN